MRAMRSFLYAIFRNVCLIIHAIWPVIGAALRRRAHLVEQAERPRLGSLEQPGRENQVRGPRRADQCDEVADVGRRQAKGALLSIDRRALLSEG